MTVCANWFKSIYAAALKMSREVPPITTEKVKGKVTE